MKISTARRFLPTLLLVGVAACLTYGIVINSPWYRGFRIPCPLCQTPFTGREWEKSGFPSIPDGNKPGFYKGVCSKCGKEHRGGALNDEEMKEKLRREISEVIKELGFKVPEIEVKNAVPTR